MRKGRAAGEYVGREAINDDAWDLQQPTTDHQGLYFVAHVAVYKCFYFPNKLSPTIVCASARTLFSLVADPSPSTQTCCPAILVVVSISGIFPTFLRPPFNNPHNTVGTGICPNIPLTNTTNSNSSKRTSVMEPLPFPFHQLSLLTCCCYHCW